MDINTKEKAQFAQQLEEAEIEFSPDFVYGLLVAYSCHGKHSSGWVRVLLPSLQRENETQAQMLMALHELKNKLTIELADTELGFNLDDDEELTIREAVLAVREWCSGFWMGIQKTKLSEKLEKNPAALEFIADLPRIASISLPEQDANIQKTGEDLFEIQEYCRIGALTVYLAMQSENL